MGEHWVIWENMEKMESINQLTKNTLNMIQNAKFFNRNTLFVKKITQYTLFYGIYTR